MCLQVNADQAITAIEERLRDRPTASEVAIVICEMLESDIRPRLPFVGRPDYLRPASLVRLIPLIYRYVRPEDDIDRSGGGPYSPTARDNASWFRTGLLSRLAQSDDPGAMVLLRGLLSCPELAAHRDWILHLLDERTVSDADYVAWDPAAIREFARVYETDPRTDSDLFQIVLNRLTDIKDDVERSDNSLREEVQEVPMSMCLGDGLLESSMSDQGGGTPFRKRRRSTSRERPDLRAENPRTSPVSIEIKWANRWTFQKLLERLENQLVGQYLQAEQSRYGIYLLGMISRKRHWESPEGNLTFSEMIERIMRRAEELKRNAPGIGGLRVVAIDFRKPS